MSSLDSLGIIIIVAAFVGVYSAIIGYSENIKEAKILYWFSIGAIIAAGAIMVILSRS